MLYKSLITTTQTSMVCNCQLLPVFNSLTKLLFNTKSYRACIDVCQTMVDLYPKNYKYFIKLAKAHHLKKHYETSISMHTTIVKWLPNNIASWRYLGEAYYYTNCCQESINTYTRYMELFRSNIHNAKGNFVIQANLAHLFYTTKQFAKSIELYEELLATDQSNIKFLLVLAQNYIESNNLLKAINVYKKCININKSTPTANINLKLLFGKYDSLPVTFFELKNKLCESKVRSPPTERNIDEQSVVIEPTCAIINIVGSEISVWVGKSLNHLDCREFSSVEYIINNISITIPHDTVLPVGCMTFITGNSFIKIKKMECWRTSIDCMHFAINVLLHCMNHYNVYKSAPIQVSDTIDQAVYFRKLGFIHKCDQANQYGDIMCIDWNRYINRTVLPYQIFRPNCTIVT